MKTKKSILKRIKITGRKKFLRRKAKQRHFKAKDPGHKTRAKRRLKEIFPGNGRKIKQIIGI